MRRYPDRGLTGRTVHEIGLRIVRGELAVGETLNVEELGERFDVSRTVIREALRVLSAKGLVDARPKRGTFVRDRENWNLLDPDVLEWRFKAAADTTVYEQLAEVRAIVEPAGAALAAQRSTRADLRLMERALEDMAAAGDDPAALTEADLRFHRALLGAAHNELLEQLEIVIEIGLRARDTLVHGHRVSPRASVRAHRRVLDAVRAQDPEGARRAMLDLLEMAAEDVRKVLRQGRGRRVVD